jgi:hypothetical protein
MSQPLFKRAKPLHKILSLLVVASLLGSLSLGAEQLEFAFPASPHAELTPGELCSKAPNRTARLRRFSHAL